MVGAGIGGLSCAALMAARGIDVTVLETHATPGGKMREVAVSGARIDAGPTVLTMPWVLEELFAACGDDFHHRVGIVRAMLLARHAWPDGSQLDLHADAERSADAIGLLAGRAAAAGYRRFCEDGRRIYRLLEPIFLRASRPSVIGLVRRHGVLRAHQLLALSSFDTLWGKLGEYFADPRLRQLFARYATYCGSSPFEAPATLMLVAHVEQDGVWYVDGGMHRIATAVMELGARHGAAFRFGTEARRLVAPNRRAQGVILASGERIDADAVVLNADPAALAGGSLGPEAAAAVPISCRDERSLSAVTWCMQARTSGFPLVRHNVFFSGDYAAEFRAMRRERAGTDAPTVYVCAQDRSDDAQLGRDGPERLFCLVNAVAEDIDGWSRTNGGSVASSRARRVQAALAGFGLSMDFDLERAMTTTPHDFQARFGAPGGAIYGSASHGWRSTFRRPRERTAIRGLYLAGGGTHPGPGVPMAALSGRLAAEAALSDLSRA